VAAIGRDAATEAALARLDGVVAVEAAVAVAGLPGTRVARVAVLLEGGGRPEAGDRGEPGVADAAGSVVRAAIDALRAAHGPGITGSIALSRRAGGVRAAVPAREVVVAAALVDAAAAGDEVLFGPRTRWALP
jgi:hypothetical protein